MRLMTLVILLLGSGFTFATVIPDDFAKEIVQTVNGKIKEIDDPLENVTRNLEFQINTSDAMPGASSGWRQGIPTVIITSSLLNVIFYTAELSVLGTEDKKWLICNSEYSSYLRNAYVDMMVQKENDQPVSKIIPLEKYEGACSGIEEKYPFVGKDKQMRDQWAKDSIAFIYLHELSHLYYNHVNYHSRNMNKEQLQRANCAMRGQEKQADIMAGRKMVKFGWYKSALDVVVWSVMSNIGIVETSRNSRLDHPTALERMAYVMDDVRGTIIATGGEISPELSAAIDESKALQEKIDKLIGQYDDKNADTLVCRQ